MKQSRFVSKNSQYSCTVSNAKTSDGFVQLSCIPGAQTRVNARAPRLGGLGNGDDRVVHAPRLGGLGNGDDRVVHTSIQNRGRIQSQLPRTNVIDAKACRGKGGCSGRKNYSSNSYDSCGKNKKEECCGYSTEVVPEWSGKRFKKARNNCAIGIIHLELDREWTLPGLPGFPEAISARFYDFLAECKDYYNIEKQEIRAFYFADLRDGNGVISPALVQAMADGYDRAVQSFKAQGIYRIIFPTATLVNDPFLRGDTPYLGGIPFKDRHPDVIMITLNTGSRAVEEQDNVYKGIRASTLDADFTQALATISAYVDKTNGVILLAYDNLAGGIDKQRAESDSIFLDSLGYNVLLRPLNSNVAQDDYLETGPGVGTLIDNLNNLPPGSAVYFYNNLGAVTADDWYTTLQNTGRFSQVFDPTLSNVTYLRGNQSDGQLGDVTYPVDIISGIFTGNVTTYNPLYKRLGYNVDPDYELFDNLEDVFLPGKIDIIELRWLWAYNWLATKGNYSNNVIANYYVWYDQGAVLPMVYQSFKPAGQQDSETVIIGKNKRYQRVLAGQAPGPFEIDFRL
jgi:hypothetical protein